MNDSIDWSDPAHPRSRLYGDVFASRAGALEQAQAVFLRGNGLPERWRGREQFVILETGFGLGHNFLATLDAWRRDPERPRRLFFLSLDAHPVSSDDLARAHAHSPLAELGAALQAQWPPRVPGWQRLDFEDGAVQLLLAFGDVREVLGQFQASVDAFFLDGFAPYLNPDMWTVEALAPLGRLAVPGATAATWCTEDLVHEALKAAGLAAERVASFDRKTTMTVARFVPDHVKVPAGRLPLAATAREAVVLGAGIAGATASQALRRAGLQVRLIDANGPASAASGNPMGMFHGTVHANDGLHARWNRAAALSSQRWLANVEHVQGLLRLSPDETPEARQARATLAAGIDPAYARSIDAAEAGLLVGLPLQDSGWFYPGGGAVSPRDWIAQLLQKQALEIAQVATVVALPEGRWRLLDADGNAIAETSLLVLAAGHRLPQLLDASLPLQAQRGGLSWWHRLDGARPQRPVAGSGYALAWGEGLLAGATASFDDDEPQLRADDHAHNQAVAERLLGRALPQPDGGRVAWRLLAADKLPLVGGLVEPNAPAPRRSTQASHWARRPGLLVIGALASRGLSWAPLAAELGTALALGQPLPVERDLANAVDPARWAARQARSTG